MSNVLSVADPTRFRQFQYALVDYGGWLCFFASIGTALCLRSFRFLRHLGSVRAIGRKDCQLRSKCLLNARGIGRGHCVFGAENPMRPIRSLICGINLSEFGRKLITKNGGLFRIKGWLG